MAFAEGTTTPVSKSREELQRVLEKAGCEELAFYTGAGGRARCAFRLKGLLCAVEVPPIDPAELAKKLKVRHERWNGRIGRYESPAEQMATKVPAEERRRWRALLLVVKAKLEAVASGISTLEEEFLANVVLANGRLLVDELRPRLKELATSPDGPRLLPDVVG